MTLDQRRHLVDLRQVWEAWTAAADRARSYLGSMVWRTSDGNDYLVRLDGPSHRRRTRSLGRRTPETEHLLHEFTAGKQQARDAVHALADRLQDMARMSRALHLARIPRAPSRILRRLHRNRVLGRNLVVVGTNALYAYEAAAGVFVASDMLATGDLDIPLDARRKLRLRGNEDAPLLLDLLRQDDPSFTQLGRTGFRAVNAAGYQVDLIKPTPQGVLFSTEPDTLGPAGDMQAAHIPNMRWIANAPKFEALAVGEDGLPVPIACPDPRAFALYKLWMGTRDPTRDPVKRLRDVQQAHAAAAIVNDHYPLLPFEPEHLACFPRQATDLASDAAFFRPS